MNADPRPRAALRWILRLAFACVAAAFACGGARAQTDALAVGWDNSSCSGCHGTPVFSSPLSAGTEPRILTMSLLSPQLADAAIVSSMRAWCGVGGAGAATTMCTGNGGYLTNPATTPDAQLIDAYRYLVAARQTTISAGSVTFAGQVAINVTHPAPQTLTLRNYRDSAVTYAISASSSADFTITDGTCAGTIPAADQSGTITNGNPGACTITVNFKPLASATTARSGSFTLTYTSTGTPPLAPNPATRTITMSGTAQVAVYNPIGFGGLTAPGFAAASDASATICRTISNATGTDTLSLAVSVLQSGGTDYSSYYELDTLAACGGGAPPLCVPANTTVSGSGNVAAGGQCTLALKFNPGKIDPPLLTLVNLARPATLRVTHNSPTAGTIVTYPLTGTVTPGPVPTISVGTTPAPNASNQVLPPAFANQVINTQSASWNEFTVANGSAVDGLTITSVSNGNPAEFTLTQDCVAASPLAHLVGNAPRCTIALSFKPTALGLRCTTVTVTAAVSSNPGNAEIVTVCGTGVPVPVAQMSVSRTSIPFGSRAIGALYPSEALTITNQTGATLPLQIGSVAIGGAGFAFVPDASACQGQQLAPGASCTLQVQFVPGAGTAGTDYAASLTLDSNDPTTPHLVVPLTARALPSGVPALVWPVGTTSLAFTDPVVVGQQSVQVLTLHLTDTGPGGADVQAVRLVGPDASHFVLGGSCPATLFEGGACDLTLRFQPGSSGAKTAQVEVVSANATVPALLGVQGLAVGSGASSLSVSPSTLSFGEVRLGARSAPLAVRLGATLGALTVTGLATEGPFTMTSNCPAVPFTLQAGADCSVMLSFAPAGTGAATGKLRITSDAAAAATEVGLDGTGQDAPDVAGGGAADPALLGLLALAIALLAVRLGRLHRRGRADSIQRHGPPG